MPGISKNKIQIIFIAIIILAGFISYGNSLDGQFVWDDNDYIANNYYIKTWSRLPEILTQDAAAGVGKRYRFYRPVQILSYKIDYALFGLNPRGYHFVSTLFHILTALSLFWLVSILFGDKILSFFTALLWAVHPVHTEAVAYISGRNDSLSFLFIILCFIFYVKQVRLKNAGLYVLMLLCYALALLSKENGLIFPALLLLYHYVFKERVKIGNFISILGIACIYIALRFTILKSVPLETTWVTTAFQRIPGFFAAVVNYIRLLVLPFDLHADYGQKTFPVFSPLVILGIIISCTVLVYAVKQRNKNKLVSFAILWFFLALLPVSNIYRLYFYMAEHWLYMPSLGFFLILGWALARMYRSEKFGTLSKFFTAALVLVYSALTMYQCEYWKEPVAFYEKTAKHSPDSVRALVNLGMVRMDEGKTDEAKELFIKALKVSPTYIYAHFALGNLYDASGEKEKAMELYERALRINPLYAPGYYDLGNLYYTIGQKQKAIETYKKALEIYPDFAAVYYTLGNAYYGIGQGQEAVASYKKAIAIQPDFAAAYNNLGNVYKNLGDEENAIRAYKKIIEMDSNNASAYYNLGKTYADMGKPEEAISQLTQVVEINPNDAETHYFLAGLYNSLGKREEAISSFKRAIKCDPSNAQVYNDLGYTYYKAEDFRQALAMFQKALEVDPGFSPAHNNLAVMYLEMKQYDRAIYHHDKAVELGHKVNPTLTELIDSHRK